MGKKSKRNRSSSGAVSRPKPPALRQPPVETKDNLRFEDPFVDEIVEETDEIVDEGGVVDEQDDDDDIPIPTKTWNPFTSSPDEELEINVEAYKMHHALTVEWPSLSFDFIRDSLGESRTRFPHSLTCVAGTQAPLAHQNYLAVMKLSDLGKIQRETDDDILGEELGKDDDDDDDDDSSDEEDVDLDPSLEHYHLPHDGGVNRVRTMPQQPSIVATWSDTGKVHIYNVQSYLDKQTNNQKDKNLPIFTHCHGIEGFAMDWSTVTTQGQLATGDCRGGVHIWNLENSNHFTVTPSYESEQQSVEDLQWSPTESTVLAAAECAGHVKVYDIRAPYRAMLSHKISDCDINVLSWNRLVGNLLATGHDDGTLCVWDLRTTFQDPLARFTSHTTPITSVEWHPTDESMLVTSDDNGVYIYDLSVEEDEKEQEKEEELPAQLLFIHSGSRQFKEVHWHPQITSCCMTTALNGFSIFIPSNL